LFFQEHDLNPFTKVPHTPKYKEILEARKTLPVFEQMDVFLEMVRPTKILDMKRAYLSSAMIMHSPLRGPPGHLQTLANLNPVQQKSDHYLGRRAWGW
jgi:hypothetical protein